MEVETFPEIGTSVVAFGSGFLLLFQGKELVTFSRSSTREISIIWIFPPRNVPLPNFKYTHTHIHIYFNISENAARLNIPFYWNVKNASENEGEPRLKRYQTWQMFQPETTLDGRVVFPPPPFSPSREPRPFASNIPRSRQQGEGGGGLSGFGLNSFRITGPGNIIKAPYNLASGWQLNFKLSLTLLLACTVRVTD